MTEIWPEPRVIASASVRQSYDEDETVTISDFRDPVHGDVVRIQVEHYDGFHAVDLPYPVWRALRAEIQKNGLVRESGSDN